MFNEPLIVSKSKDWQKKNVKIANNLKKTFLLYKDILSTGSKLELLSFPFVLKAKYLECKDLKLEFYHAKVKRIQNLFLVFS